MLKISWVSYGILKYFLDKLLKFRIVWESSTRLSNFPLHGDFPPLSAHSLSMAEDGDISLPYFSPYFEPKLHNNQLIWFS